MAMRKSSILNAALLLLTAACSGSTVAAGGNGGSGSSGAGTPTGATSGPGSTSTTSGSTTSGGSTSTGNPSGSATSSSGSSGTGGGPPGTTVTLTMDSFTVGPGQEVYYCQNYANPFGGQDAYVSEFESHMSLGSHHMLLFYKPGVTQDGPLQTCSGLEFAATPYGSQQPDDSLSFPPGVAALVPAATGLRVQAHYLNTTMNTITAHVEVDFHVVDSSLVQYPAGVLFVIDTDINVPPSSSAVVADDCTIPQDMNVIRTSSHMHDHGTSFIATVAGQTAYQTTTWSDPKPDAFDPPMTFKQGDPLHFACSFTNNGTTPLTFGESALTNEMCIFTASFYPAPAGVATMDANGCMSTQSP